MGLFYISEDAVADSTPDDDTVVLVAGGELDHHASNHLRACVASHVMAGKRRVLLDLTGVTFIDSTAIGVLVGAASRLHDSGGGWVAAVCPEDNERVLRIFDIAGVDSVITVYPTREEALSAMMIAG